MHFSQKKIKMAKKHTHQNPQNTASSAAPINIEEQQQHQQYQKQKVAPVEEQQLLEPEEQVNDDTNQPLTISEIQKKINDKLVNWPQFVTTIYTTIISIITWFLDLSITQKILLTVETNVPKTREWCDKGIELIDEYRPIVYNFANDYIIYPIAFVIYTVLKMIAFPQQLFTKLIQFPRQIYDNIITKAKEIYDQIYQKFQPLFDNVQTKLQPLIDRIEPIYTQIKEIIYACIQFVYTFITPIDRENNTAKDTELLRPRFKDETVFNYVYGRAVNFFNVVLKKPAPQQATNP